MRKGKPTGSVPWVLSVCSQYLRGPPLIAAVPARGLYVALRYFFPFGGSSSGGFLRLRGDFLEGGFLSGPLFFGGLSPPGVLSAAGLGGVRRALRR